MAKLRTSANTRTLSKYDEGGGSGPPPATTIDDSFNRADSATTLGNTDTGQAWTANRGTWGISSNQAYCVTAVDNDLASVDWGSPNMTVSVKMVAQALQRFYGVVARMTDASNYYMAMVAEGASVYLFKCVAGSYTVLVGPTSVSPPANAVLSLQASGTSLVVKINGTTVISTTDSTFTTGNRAGLRFGSTGAGANGARWEDFQVAA